MPTVNTEHIKIQYRIEIMISHEGMITASQDLPSMFLPLHVTVEPMGLMDTGLEGHLECEE